MVAANCNVPTRFLHFFGLNRSLAHSLSSRSLSIPRALLLFLSLALTLSWGSWSLIVDTSFYFSLDRPLLAGFSFYISLAFFFFDIFSIFAALGKLLVNSDYATARKTERERAPN